MHGTNISFMSRYVYPASLINKSGLIISANIIVTKIPAYDKNIGEHPTLKAIYMAGNCRDNIRGLISAFSFTRPHAYNGV